MKITIIYDNQADEGFKFGWGFSCLVNQRILFDTGEAPEPLFHNMDRLKVNINKIEAVVISHDHWDHTDGLWELLKKRKGLRVYACPGFSRKFKNKVKKHQGFLIEAETHLEIGQNISITGEIEGEYGGSRMPEQALVIKTERGITIITGCSHPGIVTMIKKVIEFFPQKRISAVLGGFHLITHDRDRIQSIAASMKNMGVENVGPTHCSGQDAQMIFKESYGEHFLSIRAGGIFEI